MACRLVQAASLGLRSFKVYGLTEGHVRINRGTSGPGCPVSAPPGIWKCVNYPCKTLPAWCHSTSVCLFVCLRSHFYMYSLKWFLKNIWTVCQGFRQVTQHSVVFFKKRDPISSGRNTLLGTGNFPASWAEAPNHSAPFIRTTNCKHRPFCNVVYTSKQFLKAQRKTVIKGSKSAQEVQLWVILFWFSRVLPYLSSSVCPHKFHLS